MTKPISAALKAHYAQSTTTIATCWKATLTNGTVFRATAHDRDIEYPAGSGEIYVSTAAYNASDVVSTSNLSVDNLELEGFLSAPSITEGDILSGIWDYAAIEMFKVNYNDLSMGRDLVRKGTLGEIRGGRTKFNVELRGMLQKLSKRIIKITTKECTHDLGDARCQVDLLAITVVGSVTEVHSQREFIDSTRLEVSDHFTAGLLTWASGANAGLKMEVKRSVVTGLFELHEAMPFPIEVGDMYSVYAGCTKRFTEDCVDKHANGPNFGGFPDLPLSEVFNGPASK